MNIHTDGITVWVNGPEGLLGRFGRYGIDIHRPLEEQTTGGECLFCTHSRVTPRDWDLFCQKMLEHFDIDVSAHKPRRFQ